MLPVSVFQTSEIPAVGQKQGELLAIKRIPYMGLTLAAPKCINRTRSRTPDSQWPLFSTDTHIFLACLALVVFYMLLIETQTRMYYVNLMVKIFN